MPAYVYMLRCCDGRYYVGSARGSLEKRIADHDAGTYGGFTARRRPVRLVWHQECQRITDAIATERQIKGWSRAKKEALIRGDFDLIHELSRRRRPFPSFETAAARPPQDEDVGDGNAEEEQDKAEKDPSS